MPSITVGPNDDVAGPDASDEPAVALLPARANPWTARLPAVPPPASANVMPTSTAASETTMIVRHPGGTSFRILHPPVVVSGRNFPKIRPNETPPSFPQAISGPD